MPPASKLEFDLEREMAYRQGYTHGAEAVMNVIVGHLPHDQIQELRKWASGGLLNWRMRSEPDVELPPDAPVLGN